MGASRIEPQYVTDCPRCHHRDCLVVFEFTHILTGWQFIVDDVRLESYGFDWTAYLHELPPGIGDYGTQNERVRCDSCGETFDLGDLMTDATVRREAG